jgi:thymidylate synthase (FAD)
MRPIPPSFDILTDLDGTEVLRRLELAARTCYKSEDRITGDPRDTERFIARILGAEHESVIEHCGATVRVTCDRGVSHEIVRHRIGAYSQESTRYARYSKAKFGSEITVIDPGALMTPEQRAVWAGAMEAAERAYMELLALGAKPQMARSVLPNSLKTEIVITYNMRSWRHFFAMRTPGTAHPQIREIARPLLREFRARIPVLFDGVGVVDDGEG